MSCCCYLFFFVTSRGRNTRCALVTGVQTCALPFFPGGGHNVMDNPIRLDDGTEWRFKDKYPLGLAPQFAGEVTDWSITTGWRTERDLGDGYSLTAALSADRKSVV